MPRLSHGTTIEALDTPDADEAEVKGHGKMSGVMGQPTDDPSEEGLEVEEHMSKDRSLTHGRMSGAVGQPTDDHSSDEGDTEPRITAT